MLEIGTDAVGGHWIRLLDRARAATAARIGGRGGGSARGAASAPAVRGRRRGEAELEHAAQAVDVEQVGVEGHRADGRHARRAVPLHEAEQRIHAPHAGPGQRTVEQRRREAPNDGARLVGLLLQGRDVAQRVDALFHGIIVRIEGLAARRLARVRLDHQPAGVEADGVGVGARA